MPSLERLQIRKTGRNTEINNASDCVNANLKPSNPYNLPPLNPTSQLPPKYFDVMLMPEPRATYITMNLLPPFY